MNRDNPKKIRVSIGTAATLGLDYVRSDVKPTTAYILTYHDGRCMANCQFCAQARDSNARLDRIARGVYQPYPLEETVRGLSNAVKKGFIRRVCIQTINYPEMFEDLVKTIKKIKAKADVPISVSRHPMSYKELNELFNLGVDRVIIPLDTASKDLFSKIKGKDVGNPYKWEGHWKGLKRALEVFGRWRVGTHIILGLGEGEKDAIEALDKLFKMGIYAGIFAYVPIKGTPMENHPKPSISHYRRVQLAYYLIRNRISDFSNLVFKDGRLLDYGIAKEELVEIIESGKPFMTAGCSDCNRPYSTEGPLGPIYNFPYPPTKNEIIEIKKELGG